MAVGSWSADVDRIGLAFVAREIFGRRIRKLPLALWDMGLMGRDALHDGIHFVHLEVSAFTVQPQFGVC